MNTTSSEIRSVIVERDFHHSPQKVWRALTQGQLIEEWLMRNNFEPVVGHQFNFYADWGTVACKVLTVEPFKSLSYSWAAFGLESVVTFELTPTLTGTQLRMQHSGFLPHQGQAHEGAKAGWQRYYAALELLLVKIH